LPPQGRNRNPQLRWRAICCIRTLLSDFCGTKLRMGSTAKCPDCARAFDPRPSGRGFGRTRCRPCQKFRDNERAKAGAMLRRAIRDGATHTELVMPLHVFERDGWVCQLCGEIVPKKSRSASGTYMGGRADSLAPTVDHTIPVKKGGDHVLGNCVTAHRTCNSQKWKNDKLPTTPKPAKPATVGPRDRCSVPRCPRSKGDYAKGMCRAHHIRVRKTGDPLKMFCRCGCRELVAVAADRFLGSYIDGHGGGGQIARNFNDLLRDGHRRQPVSDHGRSVGLTDDCHIWTGTVTRWGYGLMSVRVSTGTRRAHHVHRAAYEAAHGPESLKGKVVDHLCRVRPCFNVNHLEAVTHHENLKRGRAVIVACPEGHPYDETNLRRGQRPGSRSCKQCQRNYYHRSVIGHDFVIDPNNPSTKRERCLVCEQAKQAKRRTKCPNGHKFTDLNTEYHSTSGRRVCVQCRLDKTHLPEKGHAFAIDPNHAGKTRRCRVCARGKRSNSTRGTRNPLDLTN
jgi:hypothetical protein